MKEKLNRFTTLHVLLEILTTKRLVFSDPKYWDDKNDSEVLEIYRRTRGSKNLRALCFLEDDETIHHWKAFADGITGCCIEFDKEKLIKKLSETEGVTYGSVIYKKIDHINNGSVDDNVGMMPFIKRWPYRFEKEFRAVWDGSDDDFYVKIPDLTLINKVTISNQKPEAEILFKTIKSLLTKQGIRVNPSTVYKNEMWIKKFRTKAP